MPLGATLAAATDGIPEVVMAATLAVVTAAFPELHTEAASLVAVDTEEAATLVAVGTEAAGTVRQVVPPIPLSQPRPSSVHEHGRLRPRPTMSICVHDDVIPWPLV